MGQRINIVDFLRGITIIVMILNHFYMRFMYKQRDYGLFEDVLFFVSYTNAVLFLAVSGMSFFLFMHYKIRDGNSKGYIFFEVVKRSLFIFAIQTILAYIFGSFIDMEIDTLLYWSMF